MVYKASLNHSFPRLTKPHSIVYICFQNKFNNNIRLRTDKISLVEKSNGSKVQPFVLSMFALFPNGTQIDLRTPPGPALGRGGGGGGGEGGPNKLAAARGANTI